MVVSVSQVRTVKIGHLIPSVSQYSHLSGYFKRRLSATNAAAHKTMHYLLTSIPWSTGYVSYAQACFGAHVV